MKKLLFPVALAATFSLQSMAHDHAAPKRDFKPNGAILAFDPEEGFMMSEKALKSLGVRFSPLGFQGRWAVPAEAIVRLKHSTGVYRRVDHWITLVLVKVVKRDGSHAVIESQDLQTGDDVAVSGTTFLRMTEADLNADSVDSCSH